MSSFSLAIVRARYVPGLTVKDFGSRAYFGTYISDDIIADNRVTVSATALLANPDQFPQFCKAGR